MATQSATVEVKLTVQNANLKRGLKGAEDSLGKTKKKSEVVLEGLSDFLG